MHDELEVREGSIIDIPDPPLYIKMALLLLLIYADGILIMKMWNWFIAPLGIRRIGVMQAFGIELLVTHLTKRTGEINTNIDPFWDLYLVESTTTVVFLLSAFALHCLM